MVKLKELFIATRPWSFPMTLISITLGVVLGYYYDKLFDPFLYVLTLVGSVFLHAFTNVLNDYFDSKSGVDREGAPTTIYRPHPIIAGFMSPREVLVMSIIFLSIGSLIGIYLTLVSGLGVFIFGALGVILASMYTAPPIKFKYRALGEIGIFLSFGPIMVLGSYYVQTSKVTLEVLLASIPIGILIAAVALANNIRDRLYDSSVGIKTLATVLGNRSISIYGFMLYVSFIILITLVILGYLPLYTLISLITLPKASKLVKLFKIKVPEAADPLTAQIVILFGILSIMGIIVGVFLPLNFSLL